LVSAKDYLEDIAIFTGGVLLSREKGHRLETVDPVYVMGKCEKL
jgi:chaperonin GroEL (HSP60 family)